MDAKDGKFDVFDGTPGAADGTIHLNQERWMRRMEFFLKKIEPSVPIIEFSMRNTKRPVCPALPKKSGNKNTLPDLQGLPTVFVVVRGQTVEPLATLQGSVRKSQFNYVSYEVPIMQINSLPGKDSPHQYINLSFFAKGGMGEVYKAYDVITKDTVAIKIIYLEDPTEEQLFYTELEVSSKLSGNNISATRYSGRAVIGNTTFLYIVQDFYEKGNMRHFIKSGLSLEQCLIAMSDILEGLRIIHEVVIHRDLKPENILIDSMDKMRITDFGLAKYIDNKTRTRTFKGAGTFPYMAPECWLCEHNSIGMDIYSLGIIFFELVTGSLPSTANTEAEWRDFHVFQQLPDISQLRQDVPTKIRQIILKMTQKRVDDRYKSVNEIISALCEAIKQRNENRMEIERLAMLGHRSIEQIQAEKLAAQKKQDAIEEYKKLLNYHITNIFGNIKQQAQDINARLETTKIMINESLYFGDLTRRKLSLSFNDKNIVFSFSDYDAIEVYEENRINKFNDWQKKEYGMIIDSSGNSIFKQKHIIYIGKAESNFKSPFNKENFGYNLALVKKPNEQYGKWYLASFSDSGYSTRSNRKHFALEISDFLEQFESSFHMHTLSVIFRELDDSDISRTLEEILSP